MKLNAGWTKILKTELDSDYFISLRQYLNEEKKTTIIYPDYDLIFAAFNYTSFEDVKVVIIGQDPYHGPGQAHGLSFSVPDGIKIPPSLRNIFKEIESDVGISPPISGNLERWAKQGVLLLNSTLTVEANKAGSHQKKGWETFTDAVITNLSHKKQNIVFLLWGSFAQNKATLIDASKHRILTAVHPSPLSAYRGFLGCRHFSKTDELLIKSNLKPINW
ncbi:MAG: uracil-DNA glycosylase [Flavobacteriales bacterium]|nr:uracil-DNA glycosylase [Flavobacteriales bacterium]